MNVSSSIIVGGQNVPLMLNREAIGILMKELDVGSAAELVLRLSRPSAAQLVSILTALAWAAGGDANAERVRAEPFRLSDALQALSAIVSGASLSDDDLLPNASNPSEARDE